MAKPLYIDLPNGLRIPILHEDRNVLAIDKPPGWMLAPITWQNTGRNLFAALASGVNGGEFWAKSRNLKFIRFIHRLDAGASGVLLLVKTPGAVPAYTELFEDRKVGKVYLAVVHGAPELKEWLCELRPAPVADRPGRMEINNSIGKDAETLFRVVAARANRALVLCWPKTGRTHQIRLHLAAVGHPVLGDELYGPAPAQTGEKTAASLALRAIRLAYQDPFQAVPVCINADFTEFVRAQGFDPAEPALQDLVAPVAAPEHPKGRLPGKRPPPRARENRRGGHPAAGRDWPEEEAGGEDFRRAPRPAGRLHRRAPASGRDFRHSDSERRPFKPRPPEARSFRGPPRPGREPFGGHRPQRDEHGESGWQSRRLFERREPRSDFRGPPQGRRGYERDDRRGYDRPGGRPGAFRSQAQPGLRAGFAKPAGHSQGEERPRRPLRPGGRPPGQFGGGKPYGGYQPAWQRKPAGRPPGKFKKFYGSR